tara:strand:+ start:81234 stop:81455 length:222 start_codon:yes stop_codon:yes gene_type:complete
MEIFFLSQRRSGATFLFTSVLEISRAKAQRRSSLTFEELPRVSQLVGLKGLCEGYNFYSKWFSVSRSGAAAQR